MVFNIQLRMVDSKYRLSSFLNDNFFNWAKFKAVADYKLNVTEIMISVFVRVENIVGNGKNAGYQYFLLFSQCVQKASFAGT